LKLTGEWAWGCLFLLHALCLMHRQAPLHRGTNRHVAS
jgi:hypothetical protein